MGIVFVCGGGGGEGWGLGADFVQGNVAMLSNQYLWFFWQFQEKDLNQNHQFARGGRG